MARRCGWRTTNANPSLSSGSIFGFGAPSVFSGRASGRRIRVMNTVEITKLTASHTIAYGAVINAIGAPASPGPATFAVETVSWSFAFPSTSWSRSTSDGRDDWYATGKKQGDAATG